jgi:hypothetical protein
MGKAKQELYRYFLRQELKPYLNSLQWRFEKIEQLKREKREIEKIEKKTMVLPFFLSLLFIIKLGENHSKKEEMVKV